MHIHIHKGIFKSVNLHRYEHYGGFLRTPSPGNAATYFMKDLVTKTEFIPDSLEASPIAKQRWTSFEIEITYSMKQLPGFLGHTCVQLDHLGRNTGEKRTRGNKARERVTHQTNAVSISVTRRHVLWSWNFREKAYEQSILQEKMLFLPCR